MTTVRDRVIEDVFGGGGPLAVMAGAGYEVRRGQLEMAVAVDRCIRDGGVLLVEAPTGTGKSLATGIPAVRAVAEQGRKVLIVTANIALQEQLITKDLPEIQRAVGVAWPFTFAIAKGMGNYLCRLGFDDIAGDVAMGVARPPPGFEMVDRWHSTTLTGDLSELDEELAGALRSKITTTSEDCLGRKCPRHDECWAKRAQAAYSSANVIVTNYHMLFIDLLIKAGNDTGTGILPDYDVVVLDECHRAADIARDFFGWRVTLGGIRWCASMLEDQVLAQDLESAATAIFEAAKTRRVRKPRCKEVREFFDAGAVAGLLGRAAVELTRKATVEDEPKRVLRLKAAAKKATEHAKHLTEFAGLEDPDGVYFVESNPNGYPSLGMKPINVGPTMARLLWNNPAIHAVVATSATMTVGGKFAFLAQDCGAVEHHGFGQLIVESPFDFSMSARVVIPTDLPDPKGAFFDERVAEVLVDAVRLGRGRTLGLFTSYRVLERAHRELLAAKLPYRVLRQGEQPRTKLIAEFRRDVSSVLLGTSSFWEGVDVPGEACSVVVVDRLPFDHAEDPILDAISERHTDWFPRWMLPRAVIAWRQGFGRLIRTSADRGVVVCCDRRLVDKPYGSRFLRSLPDGVRHCRSMGAIPEQLGY